MLNMLKAIQKANNQDVSEVLADLLNAIAELSKIYYLKAAGIDPIFVKGLVPLFSSLLKDATTPENLLATLKCYGVMVS